MAKYKLQPGKTSNQEDIKKTLRIFAFNPKSAKLPYKIAITKKDKTVVPIIRVFGIRPRNSDHGKSQYTITYKKGVEKFTDNIMLKEISSLEIKKCA